MSTILSIVGTRPEAIKMAPLIKALANAAPTVQNMVCSTGQHRQMLDQVWQTFGIRPDVDLGVMTQDQTLAGVTARIMDALDGVVRETKPDWILAQGDTTTVLCASILAYYHRVKFGHVEAGLRTGDKFRPFPEEMNRRVADTMADAHFVPTTLARDMLLKEGFRPESIHITGNTVVDAVLQIAALPKTPEAERLTNDPGPYVLVTAHRRESFGEPFRDLCRAIRTLAERFLDKKIRFVFPVHLNPNVRKPVYEILAECPNVVLCEPVDYQTMVHLIRNSVLVLTDSGGIQEESPAFGVPVLVMRDTTERPEGVDAGVAKLVGTSCDRIVHETSHLLVDSSARQSMRCAVNPYGDGRAGERIVQILLASAGCAGDAR
jgi:UDP-N-acetylglucosamine 2-epimerase